MPFFRARASFVATAAIALAVAFAAGGCVESSTEHRIRANALFKGGDYAAALAECDQGLAKKPDDASLLVLKGKTAFELGRLDDARAAYQHAVDVGKDKRGVFLGDAYLGLAIVATRTSDWASARARFLDLLELNPRDATSHANLAKIELELGSTAEAISHAEQAARIRGDDEQVLFTLGSVYLAAGRLDEAMKTFEHSSTLGS